MELNKKNPLRKPKKLRRLFAGYIAVFCAGTILLIGLFIAGIFFLMSSGVILTADYGQQQLAAIREKIAQSRTVTSDMIPNTCSYAVFTKKGKLLSGSMSKKEAATAWNVTQVKGSNQYNNYFYLPIPRKNQMCIVRYTLYVQYSSPVLRRFLPAPGAFFFPLFGAAFLLEVFLLASIFGKSLSKKLRNLQSATEKIEKQDLNFTVESSGIYEIDNVLYSIDKMKEALKASLQKQWALEETRRNQISALAHDIKTPITVVRGNVDLLSETEQTEEQKEFTGYIAESTSQMEQYVKTMIEISKAEAGYSLCKQKLDANIFSEELRKQICALAASKRLTISFKTENLPQSFCADSDLLKRAVGNIVSNAVDFSPEEGTVLFNIRCADGKLQFCVTDSGKGFSADTQKNAAKQFYMGDKSRTSKAHYGMGLFIAKTIADQHNGALYIENSQETGGGKVTIEIPVIAVT